MKKSRTKPLVEKCTKCGNERRNGRCAYCAWKGWEGPGAMLRTLIKENNDALQK